jgi:hypothetical protein
VGENLTKSNKELKPFFGIKIAEILSYEIISQTTQKRKRGRVLARSNGDRLGGIRMAKIVIGVFRDFRAVSNATPDLVRAGIPQEHVNTVAQDRSGQYPHNFVGILNSIGVLEREARAYEVAVREGRSLIIVRTTDVMAVQVMEIFQNHHAVHISMRSPQPVKNERAEFALAAS